MDGALAIQMCERLLQRECVRICAGLTTSDEFQAEVLLILPR